jgi:hypothetical protein
MVLRFGVLQLCRSKLCRVIAGYGLFYTSQRLDPKPTEPLYSWRILKWALGAKALNKAECTFPPQMGPIFLRMLVIGPMCV